MHDCPKDAKAIRFGKTFKNTKQGLDVFRLTLFGNKRINNLLKSP